MTHHQMTRLNLTSYTPSPTQLLHPLPTAPSPPIPNMLHMLPLQLHPLPALLQGAMHNTT